MVLETATFTNQRISHLSSKVRVRVRVRGLSTNIVVITISGRDTVKLQEDIEITSYIPTIVQTCFHGLDFVTQLVSTMAGSYLSAALPATPASTSSEIRILWQRKCGVSP